MAWGRMLFVSLLLHTGFVAGVVFLLEHSGEFSADNPVEVYTVRMIEVSPQPKIRGVDVTAAVLRPLSLGPLFAEMLPPIPAVEPSALDSLALSAPPLAPPAPLPNAPATPLAAGAVPAELVPVGPGGAITQPAKTASDPSAEAVVRSTPSSTAAAPEQSSPGLERLRKRLHTLNLEVRIENAAPNTETLAQDDLTQAIRQEDPRMLRIFSKNLQDAVQQNYSFPGQFPAHLRAVVRVWLARDGEKNRIELAQSSGDARFDKRVCLDRIYNTPFPPVPEEIQHTPLLLTFTCAP